MTTFGALHKQILRRCGHCSCAILCNLIVQILSSGYGLVAMTFASHVKGREFDPHYPYVCSFGSLHHGCLLHLQLSPGKIKIGQNCAQEVWIMLVMPSLKQKKRQGISVDEMVLCVDVALKIAWLQFKTAKLNLTLCPRQRKPCGNVRFKGRMAIVAILVHCTKHDCYGWATLLTSSCCSILDELFGNQLEALSRRDFKQISTQATIKFAISDICWSVHIFGRVRAVNLMGKHSKKKSHTTTNIKTMLAHICVFFFKNRWQIILQAFGSCSLQEKFPQTVPCFGNDSCGVRTHALADWRLEPAPQTTRPNCPEIYCISCLINTIALFFPH